MNKKIKVLVVDDSIVFRKILTLSINTDSNLEVVASAPNPYIARDKIIEFMPDVITLDVEMPGMDGIEFLRRLMPQYPVPVVVVSSLSEKVLDAYNAGAVEFISKPDINSSGDIETFVNELVAKIKIASISKIRQKEKNDSREIHKINNSHSENIIIAMGASTGGTEAVFSILKRLPEDMPGIVVVQHMPPVFSRMFAERLNKFCSMEVREAIDGDEIVPGLALIAPGGYHMAIRKSGKEYFVECFKEDKVNGHCPSVDVLFESVADRAGKNAIGIILTGMGYDGAKGLLSMKKKGASTIGQDEDSCVVYGMPRVAFNIGAVEKVCSLGNIPACICSIIKKQQARQ